MSDSNPSFFARIFLALGAFWQVVFNAEFAAAVRRLRQGEGGAPPAPAPQMQTQPLLLAAAPDAALQLLGLLQRDGRFIDFIEEEVANYSDAEIGAAARVIHEGCRKTLREHFAIEPIRSENEGARITLEKGFDAAAIRLTGNVVGSAPFSGSLTHKGWRAAKVELPKTTAGHDVTVIAPAEVEL